MSNGDSLPEFLLPVIQRFETQNLAIKVLFAVAYTIIISLSLFSNLLVCYTVLKNWRSMRNSHLFILNMVAVDMLLTLVNSTFALVRLCTFFMSGGLITAPRVMLC